MFLYVITNRVNGKQYVGITTNIEQRWREHRSGHGSKPVYHAVRKYGADGLQWEVWYEGNEDWSKMMEYRAIVMLETRAPHGYNLTLGGEGSVGWKPNDDTKARMRAAHLGKKHSLTPETREKISKAHREKKCSAEVLARLTDTAGSKNPRARSVVVNGVEYGCIKDAARATNINVNTLYTRLRRYEQAGLWPVGWGLKTPV